MVISMHAPVHQDRQRFEQDIMEAVSSAKGRSQLPAEDSERLSAAVQALEAASDQEPTLDWRLDGRWKLL
jgi:hypothetical protein